jgi:hypothetical protein
MDSYKKIGKIFYQIERNTDPLRSPNYSPSIIPSIKEDEYLERMNWVNIRTEAYFGFPCSICGSTKNIEMHHIKHIRKRVYALISEVATWEQVMNLRNRKQIPVCKKCHREKIHEGKYNGPPLSSLAPLKKTILYDNRILHIESFVKIGKVYHAKSLEEKGWKEI